MFNPHYERLEQRLTDLRDNAKTERQWRHYDSLLDDLRNVGNEYERFIETLQDEVLIGQLPDYEE